MCGKGCGEAIGKGDSKTLDHRFTQIFADFLDWNFESGGVDRQERSRIFRLRASVVVHVRGPSEEADHFATLAPHDSPELEEADVLHLDAGIGLEPPLQIRATPRSEMVSAGGVPEKAKDVTHGISLP